MCLKTVETDGCQSAKAFAIGTQMYLFIANGGSVGRYQATSRVYQVQPDGTLLVVIMFVDILC